MEGYCYYYIQVLDLLTGYLDTWPTTRKETITVVHVLGWRWESNDGQWVLRKIKGDIQPITKADWLQGLIFKLNNP